MSQLASFTLLPKEAVRHLIPAAMPRKRLFKKPEYRFNEYLQTHGRDLGGFEDGDGFYIILVLLYLREFCKINLLDGNEGLTLMAGALSKHQGSAFAFFTEDEKKHAQAIRSLSFDSAKLRTLLDKEKIAFERFTDTETLEAARDNIADLLERMPAEHVVLASVG